MDFDILPQLIIIFSVAGILFIIGKNFAKVKEASEADLVFMKTSAEASEEKEKFLYLYKRAVRRINKENYHKYIAKFWLWFEKFLRKIRLTFLKLDSKMLLILENVRKRNAASFEKLMETERAFRKNMENENLAKFWNAKKQELKKKNDTAKPTEESKGRQQKTADWQETGSVEKIDSEIKTQKVGTNESEMEIIEEILEITPVQEEPRENMDVTVAEEEILETMPECIAETKSAHEKEPLEETEEEQKVRTKREQECIEILMKNPVDIKAYWRLGIIYSKRHNYDDALACFRQIVKIDPTYTKAKQKAIELMEKMKRKTK